MILSLNDRGEMNGVQSKTLSLRGAKRRGNPHPLMCDVGPEKRERIPTSACGLLGMTEERRTERSQKLCHCEERSDVAIRIPLCAMWNAEKKRTDSHVGAVPLLGMTGEK